MMIQGHQDFKMPPFQAVPRPGNGIFSAQPMGGMPTIPASLAPGANQTAPAMPGAPTAPSASPAPSPAPPAAPANPLSPGDALNNFANSAGMQFQLQQGANALNNLYAAHGDIQSGAAAKALQNYGQQTALQNYFMPYMNFLQGQQGMGVGAGSSIAGVGTSFGNTAANINSNAANAIGNGAINIGNANAEQAAINGYGNANLYNTIGSSLGNVASSFVKPQY